MALIITPGQLAHRADLYHQLAQLTAAGIGLPQALEIQRRSPPDQAFRQPLGALIERLQRGSTFSDAARSLAGFLPAFDVALLQAGETSGRLPACFKLLAEYYGQRAQLMRRVLGKVAYPLLLLHAMVVIFPVSALQSLVGQGTILGFIFSKLAVFVPLYGGTFLLLYVSQGQRGEKWRTLIEAVAHPIPLLGTARRSLAVARLSAALEALISAGASIIEAWELAAEASGSPALGRAVRRFRPQLETGTTPAEAVSDSGVFPQLFVSEYHSAEVSGRTDEALRRLNGYYQEEGSRLLNMFIIVFGAMLYGGMALLVAWQVVSFYMGYYGGLLGGAGE